MFTLLDWRGARGSGRPSPNNNRTNNKHDKVDYDIS